MTLPNMLTVSRLLFTAGFVYFVTRQGMTPLVMAFFLFVLASLTDYFDGYYARKHNMISTFGKIMDPIADKFLILAAFFVFARMDFVAAWMFYAILVRELTVTGSRLVAMKRGSVLAAERAGKFKTCLQLLAIAVIMLYMILIEAGVTAPLYDDPNRQWIASINILMILTTALTLFSGFSYFWNNRNFLSI